MELPMRRNYKTCSRIKTKSMPPQELNTVIENKDKNSFASIAHSLKPRNEFELKRCQVRSFI